MTFDNGGDKRPSPSRIAIWVIVGGIGAYMLLAGIIGIVSGGGA